MLYEVERTTASGRLTVRIRGDLDLGTAPGLTEYVDAQLTAGIRALVVDLSGVAFLDSTGARQLALIARHCADAGVALTVVCPRRNRPVWLVVELLELDRVVPIVESAPPDGSAPESAPPDDGAPESAPPDDGGP